MAVYCGAASIAVIDIYMYVVGANAELNRQGIDAVKSVLKEARKIARTLPPEKRAAIEQMCNEIEALMQELADLQARGLVSDWKGGMERGEGEGGVKRKIKWGGERWEGEGEQGVERDGG